MTNTMLFFSCLRFSRLLTGRALVFGLVLTSCSGLVARSTCAQDTGPAYADPWPSPWANVVTAIPGSDEVVVGTAEGLLLRESAVVATSPSSPDKVRVLYKHPASVWGVVAAGQRIASSDYRGNLMVLDRNSGEVKTHEGALERWTRALLAAPDQKHIVAGNEAGKLFAWDLDSGQATKSLQLDAQQVFALAISPAGDQLAACDGAGQVHIVSWPALELQRKLKLGDQALWGVQFTSDGQAVVAGGAERKLWRCGVAEGSEPVVVHEGADWITSIQASPDRSVMIVTLMNGDLWSSDGAGSRVQVVGQLPSAVWASTMVGSNRVAVGTRKHALATLQQSWTIGYASEPGTAPPSP